MNGQQGKKNTSLLLRMGLSVLCLFLSFLCTACAQTPTVDFGATDTPTGGETDTSAPEDTPTRPQLPSYGGQKTLGVTLTEKEKAANARLTVVIDAGHGQDDPGVLAFREGTSIRESDVNLALALRLDVILSNMGYETVMIRDDDSALLGASGDAYDTDEEAKARRELAEELGTDMYISLHCNSAPANPDARGTRLFLNGRVGVSFPARAIAEHFRLSLNSTFAGEIAASGWQSVENNHVNPMSKPYIVLDNKEMPAILFEIGFFTNESDLLLLLDSDFLWEYADALAKGMLSAKREGLFD